MLKENTTSYTKPVPPLTHKVLKDAIDSITRIEQSEIIKDVRFGLNVSIDSWLEEHGIKKVPERRAFKTAYGTVPLIYDEDMPRDEIRLMNNAGEIIWSNKPTNL